MVPLLPLRDGVRALPISFFRQSMPSFYMNAPDCICSPGRLPLGAFCTGRDGRYGQDWPTRCAFQSAHPVRGATGGSAEAANGMVDFNPRTPCGVRRHRAQARRWWGNFNPRTPCGVRPEAAQRLPTAWSISIHAPRAGCDVIGHKPGAGGVISIHAPRAGCDHPHRRGRQRLSISIHAPRAGCDKASRSSSI